MADPQWKDCPQYVIVQEDLTDFDDLTSYDHPHLPLILLIKDAKDMEKEERVRVRV
jgi:hypothetical protein